MDDLGGFSTPIFGSTPIYSSWFKATQGVVSVVWGNLIGPARISGHVSLHLRLHCQGLWKFWSRWRREFSGGELMDKFENITLKGRDVMYTFPKTNSSHLKIGLPNRKVVFQPSIFRGYVSFREGIVSVWKKEREILSLPCLFAGWSFFSSLGWKTTSWW